MPPNGVEIGKMTHVSKTLPPSFRRRFGVERMAVQFDFPPNLQRFTLPVFLHAGGTKPCACWRRRNVFDQPMPSPHMGNLAVLRLA